MSAAAEAADPRSSLARLTRLFSRDGTNPGRGDPIESLTRVIQVGGPLARSPSVFALVRRDGGLIAANPATGPIEAALRRDPRVAEAVGVALGHDEVVEQTLAVPGPDGAEAQWRLLVVPVPDSGVAVVQATDETRQRSIERALVESRQRFKDLVEISSDLAWEVDADVRFAFVSPRGALGYAAEQLIGRKPETFLASDGFLGAMSPFSARSRMTDVETWFRRADGGMALLQVTAVPLVDEHGVWVGARGVCRDITTTYEREQALKAAERREQLLGFVLRRMQVDTDPAKTLKAAAHAVSVALSAESCAIFRTLPGGDGALAPTARFGPETGDDGTAHRLFALARDSGAPSMAADADRHAMAATTAYQKRVNGGIAISRPAAAGAWNAQDVKVFEEVALRVGVVLEQMDHQARLETISRVDELTGLLNRRAFMADLEARMGGRRKAVGALMFIDLDNFKIVNDRHGHARGDKALQAVAKLLRDKTRDDDVLARLGGDEFAIWLDKADAAQAQARGEALIAGAADLGGLSGDPGRPLGLSIGVAVARGIASEQIADLIRRGDEAMYRVKAGGKGAVAVAGDRPRSDAATEEEPDAESASESGGESLAAEGEPA